MAEDVPGLVPFRHVADELRRSPHLALVEPDGVPLTEAHAGAQIVFHRGRRAVVRRPPADEMAVHEKIGQLHPHLAAVLVGMRIRTAVDRHRARIADVEGRHRIHATGNVPAHEGVDLVECMLGIAFRCEEHGLLAAGTGIRQNLAVPFLPPAAAAKGMAMLGIAAVDGRKRAHLVHVVAVEIGDVHHLVAVLAHLVVPGARSRTHRREDDGLSVRLHGTVLLRVDRPVALAARAIGAARGEGEVLGSAVEHIPKMPIRIRHRVAAHAVDLLDALLEPGLGGEIVRIVVVERLAMPHVPVRHHGNAQPILAGLHVGNGVRGEPVGTDDEAELLEPLWRGHAPLRSHLRIPDGVLTRPVAIEECRRVPVAVERTPGDRPRHHAARTRLPSVPGETMRELHMHRRIRGPSLQDDALRAPLRIVSRHVEAPSCGLVPDGLPGHHAVHRRIGTAAARCIGTRIRLDFAHAGRIERPHRTTRGEEIERPHGRLGKRVAVISRLPFKGPVQAIPAVLLRACCPNRDNQIGQRPHVHGTFEHPATPLALGRRLHGRPRVVGSEFESAPRRNLLHADGEQPLRSRRQQALAPADGPNLGLVLQNAHANIQIARANRGDRLPRANLVDGVVKSQPANPRQHFHGRFGRQRLHGTRRRPKPVERLARERRPVPGLAVGRAMGAMQIVDRTVRVRIGAAVGGIHLREIIARKERNPGTANRTIRLAVARKLVGDNAFLGIGHRAFRKGAERELDNARLQLAPGLAAL